MPALFAVVCLLSLEVGFSRPLWDGDGTSWFEDMASSLNSGYKRPIQDSLGTPMQVSQVPSPGEQPDPPAQPKDVANLAAAQASHNPGVAPEAPQNTASEAFHQPFMNSPLFSFLFDPFFRQPQYGMPQNQGQQNAFQPSNAELKNQPNAPSRPESPGSQPEQAPGQDATFQSGLNPASQPQPNSGFQNQQNPPFQGQTPGSYGPAKQYLFYKDPIFSELGYMDRLMRNFMFW